MPTLQFDPKIVFSLGLEGLFYLLLLAYTINGAFLAYHWYAYGASRNVASIALATYLLGGAVLFLTIATSLWLI